MARQSQNEAYVIGRTGYRLTVSTYQQNESPCVVVDIHDSSGTIIDRAVLTAPIVTGKAPQLDIVRTAGASEDAAEGTDNG